MPVAILGDECEDVKDSVIKKKSTKQVVFIIRLGINKSHRILCPRDTVNRDSDLGDARLRHLL